MSKIALAIVIFAVVSIGIAIDVSNIKECKAHGFSTLFCVTQVK